MDYGELWLSLFGTINQDTRDAFREYHAKRPEIYKLFLQYSTQMMSTGRKRYSAKCIMERIRWEEDFKRPGSQFKISNSFTSIYVRMLIYNHPEFADFFKLKKVRGLRKPFKAHVDDNEYLSIPGATNG